MNPTPPAGRVCIWLLALVAAGCADAPPVTSRMGRPDAAAPRADAGTASDAAATRDAAPPVPDASLDAAVAPLGPPVARPPSPPPDLRDVVEALAAERPDLLEASCVARGGNNEFLFEATRRLRARDPRWGLDRPGGVLGQDVVDYFWGDGAPEGSRDVYVIDIIARVCPVPGTSAAPGWLDVSAMGGVWSLVGLPGAGPPPVGTVDAGAPPLPPDAGAGTTPLPLPDGSDTVDAVAADHADWLSGSCVESGGDNEFLFEVVRRLRRLDPRWGLNWKRGRVGDMSQDAITYHFGPGAPVESSTDVYIIDVIGGHCGPAPSPAFTDVTEATRLGGTIGRWTLAGRTDLGP